jgi:hypothetical protein
MNKLILLSILTFGLSWGATTAQAAIMTYVLSGTGASGTFDGIAFSGQSFTVTMTADSATLATRNYGGALQVPSVQATTLSYLVGANSLAVATTPGDFYLFDFTSVLPDALGFATLSSLSGNSWETTGSTAWDLVSNFPSAASAYRDGQSVTTDQGPIRISAWSAATFTATAASVPEPSAFLLGLGALAGLVIRRRR